MSAAPLRFELSMFEVVLSAVGGVLKRRSRTFDSAEDLAEHYELQKLLRGEPADWPAHRRSRSTDQHKRFPVDLDLDKLHPLPNRRAAR